MMFFLGMIVGILLTLVVAVVIAFFRAPVVNMVERRYRDIQEHAKAVGVGQTGFVYTPPDDAEIARQEIIEANNKIGRDTPISELQ